MKYIRYNRKNSKLNTEIREQLILADRKLVLTKQTMQELTKKLF